MLSIDTRRSTIANRFVPQRSVAACEGGKVCLTVDLTIMNMNENQLCYVCLQYCISIEQILVLLSIMA